MPEDIEIVRDLRKQVIDWGVSAVHAQDAWKETKGESVKVVIIDTGVDTNHPDLAENIKFTYNTMNDTDNVYDDNGHGTHVAGIIAGVDNDFGIVGIAPKVDLYILKAMGANGSGTIVSIVKAVYIAISQGVDIISMSLGVCKEPDSRLHDALKVAHEQGIIIVAASGNEAHDCDYPAKYEECIAVGAVDSDFEVADFSNTGVELDIVAPGVDILSTYPGGVYARLSGTSMATPIVSGVIALYISHCKVRGIHYSFETVLEKLGTAKDLGTAGQDPVYGKGLVDALTILQD